MLVEACYLHLNLDFDGMDSVDINTAGTGGGRTKLESNPVCTKHEHGTAQLIHCEYTAAA